MNNQYPQLKLLIDGQWRTRPGEPVLNPADGSVLGTVPHATIGDLDEALAAAARGFKVWKRMAPAKRAAIMLKGAQLLRERADSIALALTLEQGKPLAQSHAEIVRTCDILEWDAHEGRRVYGRVIPSQEGMRHTVLRQPIGVVAAFSPWNFPISSPARKIGGALAAGCSIILKASEETPAGAVMLAAALTDAGVPAGVLNLVFGNPAQISAHLIANPVVRLISLTGSVPVGKLLAEQAARYMKPTIMELGGHAPVIVCEDADPLVAAKASVIGKSRNAGQVCVSATRFFVHEKIYDEFCKAFANQAAAIKIGSGLDPDTQMGPLVNERRVTAIESLVNNAVEKGATVLTGGKREGTTGFFFPLTVLSDMPSDALAMHTEPFGPLALITKVQSVEEAIELANEVPYGLAAYAFTSSAKNADLLARELECGNLSINHFVASLAETPFGGVKESGYGREGGVEGLEGYTVVKNVSHLML